MRCTRTLLRSGADPHRKTDDFTTSNMFLSNVRLDFVLGPALLSDFFLSKDSTWLVRPQPCAMVLSTRQRAARKTAFRSALEDAASASMRAHRGFKMNVNIHKARPWWLHVQQQAVLLW